VLSHITEERHDFELGEPVSVIHEFRTRVGVVELEESSELPALPLGVLGNGLERLQRTFAASPAGISY
jgi:hypothetical protein